MTQSGHKLRRVLFLPLISRGRKMIRVAQLTFIALMLMSSPVVLAGPAEDANAAVYRWSSAYSTNDPENIAKTYWPDAMLLGTVTPVMSDGTQEIVTYFTPSKGRAMSAFGPKRDIPS